MGVGLFALQLECGCKGGEERSVLAKERRFGASSAPESQTLIVLSFDPDTILVPSGENATERIQSLWALVCSTFNSSVAAREGMNGQFWPRRGDLGPKTHRNPRL